MLNVLKSKWKHSLGRFLFFFMLLLLAMVFLSISLQMYLQSVQSAQTIEENTVTVALPQFVYSMSERGVPVEIVYEDTQYEQLYSSESVIGLQEGRTFSGRSDGLYPVVPTLFERSRNRPAARSTEEICVFRIKCIGKVLPSYNEWLEWDNEQQKSTFLKELSYYTVQAEVLDVYTHNPSFDEFTPTVQIFSKYMLKDGTYPFEEGKEYIIMCRYDMCVGKFDKNKLGKFIYYAPDPAEDFLNVDMGYHLAYYFGKSVPVFKHNYEKFTAENGDTYHYTFLPENQLMVLPADDPRVPEMIELGKINSQLLYVTGIDALQGVYQFAYQYASVIDGRDMTRTEYESGAKVCLISSSFAKKNHLKIGDSIPLELYDNDVVSNGHPILDDSSVGMEFLYEIKAPDAVEHYTIVGLYESPEWEFNKYCFTPNTVFVPEKSLPAQGGTSGVEYAASVILKNGSNALFLEALKEAGIKENKYVIHDNGYPEYMESLMLLQKDTLMVLIVCTLLFLVVLFSAFYMITLHLSGDALLMLRLGAQKRTAGSYMFFSLLPFILLATVSAYAISCALYLPITQTLESMYSLIRPHFSIMTNSSTGVLLSTMEAWPSPLGAVLSLASSLLVSLLMLRIHFERRKT